VWRKWARRFASIEHRFSIIQAMIAHRKSVKGGPFLPRAAEQLIEPDREQRGLHARGLLCFCGSARRVNSGVRHLLSGKEEHIKCRVVLSVTLQIRKTLPMIYGAGSSTSKSSSFWITSKGRIGAGSGRGSRQSHLAKAAAPPRPPSFLLGCIGMFLVFILFILAIGMAGGAVERSLPKGPPLETWLRLKPFIPISLGALILIVGLIRYWAKRKRHAPRLAEWQRTWACLKCGTTWSG